MLLCQSINIILIFSVKIVFSIEVLQFIARHETGPSESGKHTACNIRSKIKINKFSINSAQHELILYIRNTIKKMKMLSKKANLTIFFKTHLVYTIP